MMRHGYVPGGSADIFMHEPVTCFESAVQDEMHMGVHQGKSQNDHVVVLDHHVYPVHPGDEVIVVFEHGIDGVSVRAEMPAVLDFDLTSLDERDMEPEIGFDLREQFLIYLHVLFRRLLWLLFYKDRSILPFLQPDFCRASQPANPALYEASRCSARQKCRAKHRIVVPMLYKAVDNALRISGWGGRGTRSRGGGLKEMGM